MEGGLLGPFPDQRVEVQNGAELVVAAFVNPHLRREIARTWTCGNEPAKGMDTLIVWFQLLIIAQGSDFRDVPANIRMSFRP
jgi:hypothetical protein